VAVSIDNNIDLRHKFSYCYRSGIARIIDSDVRYADQHIIFARKLGGYQFCFNYWVAKCNTLDALRICFVGSLWSCESKECYTHTAYVANVIGREYSLSILVDIGCQDFKFCHFGEFY